MQEEQIKTLNLEIVKNDSNSSDLTQTKNLDLEPSESN